MYRLPPITSTRIHEACHRWLRDFLRARIAPYKVPRTYERVTEPLRDDAGKVRRLALRAARVTSYVRSAPIARAGDTCHVLLTCE